MSAKPIPSPCIGVCRIDERSGFCLGCYRTLDEIGGWPLMTDVEKAAILETLPRRTISRKRRGGRQLRDDRLERR